MSTNFNKTLQQAQASWMDIEGVISVAEGLKNQQRCIDVYFAGSPEKIKDQIPSEYKGIPIVLKNSGGKFEAY